MRRSLLIKLAVSAVVVAAVGAALWLWTRPEPVAVLVRAIERGSVESTVANTRAGTVKACRRARLSPTTGGRVAELPIRRGDRVEAGALLLRVWSEDLEAQRKLARTEETTASAAAEEACLAADLARSEAERMTRLRDEGIVNQEMHDRAVSQREQSAAGCAAARARIDQARSRTRVAEQELAKTVLRAPFAGIVAELNAEIGEIVTPSPPGIPTPPAVDLIEESCLYVVAPIDEVDAPRVRLGQPATVTLDAFPGRQFAARVTRIAPYVLDREKQARTVDVEVAIDDPASIPELIAGYSADVEVLLERRDGVLRVPTEAIYADDRVLVLEGGRLAEQRLERGLSSWKWTEVRSGVTEGQHVVVSLDRAGAIAGAAAVAEASAAP